MKHHVVASCSWLSSR